jgi:hypothetical protein
MPVGILADIFICDPADAPEYEKRLRAGGMATDSRYQRVEYNGVTGLEFGTLWALLENRFWDVQRHMLDDLAYGKSDETWLNQFPEGFVSLLAAMDDEALKQIAARWSKTDELHGTNPSDLLPILVDLKRLALAAKATKRQLYLWGSL